jgi:2-polyprenyl-6-methoxyphenol hydroxylase-like FAD-dependent oxidoreductase
MEPILVAGAGIGGLSTAVALALKGFKVCIYERAPEIREVGAGLQMGPNGFRAFEQLHVAEAMRRITFKPDAIVLMDSPSGTEICRQELGDSFLQRFGYPYQVGFRADVQSVLLQAARTYPDLIEIHLGDGVGSFVQDDDGVLVELDSGKRAPGFALIGADGLWSQTRTAIVGDAQPRVSGHIAYRAVLPVSEVPSDILTDDVQVWVGPKHHLVCYKLRGGTLFNIVAIFHSARYLEGWDSEADISELRIGFADACQRVQKLLDHVQTWRMWVLCDRDPVQGWSSGRVTLVGDAAHPMLPYLAQGACMAIEDAVCLADKLSNCHGNVAAAFNAYENARFARTASVQRAAREMGELNHADGIAREMRNKALAARDPRDHEPNAWLFETDGPRDKDASLSFFGPLR